MRARKKKTPTRHVVAGSGRGEARVVLHTSTRVCPFPSPLPPSTTTSRGHQEATQNRIRAYIGNRNVSAHTLATLRRVHRGWTEWAEMTEHDDDIVFGVNLPWMAFVHNTHIVVVVVAFTLSFDISTHPLLAHPPVPSPNPSACAARHDTLYDIYGW